MAVAGPGQRGPGFDGQGVGADVRGRMGQGQDAGQRRPANRRRSPRRRRRSGRGSSCRSRPRAPRPAIRAAASGTWRRPSPASTWALVDCRPKETRLTPARRYVAEMLLVRILGIALDRHLGVGGAGYGRRECGRASRGAGATGCRLRRRHWWRGRGHPSSVRRRSSVTQASA